jgi:uncharacterized protein YjiS (DUF1127 family)
MGRKPLSLRGLAGLLGASEGAIRKAIRSGRLAKSIGRDERGRPFVLDLAVAKREWATNRSAPAPAADGGNGAAAGASVAKAATGMPENLTEAQIRVQFQREVKLELENLQKQGKLLDAAVARRDAFNGARMIRDGLLNLPDRLAAELAAMTDPAAIHERMVVECRAVLEPLADLLEHGDG